MAKSTMAAVMDNDHHHPIPRPRRTLLVAAMDPHYCAAIDIVHHLQMRCAVGLYTLRQQTSHNRPGTPYTVPFMMLPKTFRNDTPSRLMQRRTLLKPLSQRRKLSNSLLSNSNSNICTVLKYNYLPSYSNCKITSQN